MKLLASVREWIARHRHSGLFNKYFVAFMVFIVWLAFFDRHNLIVQYKLFSNVKELEREKHEYADKLEDVLTERQLMQTQAERYARERYFMHKPDEEVFVIRRK
jgi:cell division protein DivIC